ncbi:AcrB/AcrD/AcrF family protein [Oceanidesulfovibrio indonesiensis]|uniref:AcrB/AcrD/AcrF family protein n=1 Tax=Oceanidesulfovibrio indonesiensis TaxID=54767 RepID=A0A7M3MAT0_9BACT|nr:efflux RND transporter permease subunit [Oceanidesulfovibrio indonesiensis]TVM15030.1 AcrB/AcrD/AcrF family protein [Oceanidesulfovibrio indonesiensis]
MVDEKHESGRRMSFAERFVGACLQYRVVVFVVAGLLLFWGVSVAPFDWKIESIPRDPVPVDAIPDIGENQQIVFTEWPGRSPQDVEDQISYPLTTALLGIPGVKTVRSVSMFGFSSIYVIFEEGIEFYWSRSRMLEKLASLPAGSLPQGVRPTLGPDATALGQVYWYTLEGRDKDGNPTGGWNLDELRSVQDWYMRYGLQSAEGVSEVASIGGFVREYQVDVNPEAMRAANVTLEMVMRAVARSNLDVGARTIEVNSVEYVVRGVGFIKKIEDLEKSVVLAREDQPITVGDVATVQLGPAMRRGVLDKGGAEVVGGVVVARYGENPLAVIQNTKDKIKELEPGLPSKVLPDGRTSQLEVVPFYDRSGLIHETLGTLQTALTDQILVTVVVVLVTVLHLEGSLLIASLLPMAVLLCFTAMKSFGVDANIVALSGIAIAIGTMVDMGIIITENILKRFDEAPEGTPTWRIIREATGEVAGAVLTAVATTIVSFLPVFAMEGAEGKLFKPLAFTKTFALFASIAVSVTVLPVLATIFLRRGKSGKETSRLLSFLVIAAGVGLAFIAQWWIGAAVVLVGVARFASMAMPARAARWLRHSAVLLLAMAVAIVLATHWMPLGPEHGLARNALFTILLMGLLLGFFALFQKAYPTMLRRVLDFKALFMLVPATVLVIGLMVWLGFPRVFGWLPDSIQSSRPAIAMAHAFPGLGKEFMPPLDEGSFLFMPTTMPHASIGEVKDVLAKQDMAMAAIPEVESAVGKLGRVESSLDPAPLSMIETVVNYVPEYLADQSGHRKRFAYRDDKFDYYRTPEGEPVNAPDGLPYLVRGKFMRDEDGKLIPDEDGRPFRLWRPAIDPSINEGRDAWPGIQSPQDIWDEVVKAAEVPGTTSAPFLQPIAARIVMLQSGMRAPMGIKVRGPDLETIESVGLELERLLKEVPSVQPAAVIADRIVGKPYLEIEINRTAIARYGLPLEDVQEVIEAAVGGRQLTTTVEGRERYPVRVRYQRELRDTPEALGSILVAARSGEQIPLRELADIRYVRGPQAIKSEDTFLVGYVLFDKKPGFAEVDVVEHARSYLDSKRESGELVLPEGVSYTFAGSYENQIRAQKRLAVILPVALAIIFLILYLQFKQLSVTMIVFSGIAVAWSGGFILIWLYGQEWFLAFNIFGESMRDLFQVNPVNLSVAIWVGFLALFGIASDDGVLMATYLLDSKDERDTTEKKKLRDAVVAGATRRIRPALMTSATTILALLPVLTSTGRGADIMVPMAIPSFGGMLVALLTVFVVPVLFCAIEEWRLYWRKRRGLPVS